MKAEDRYNPIADAAMEIYVSHCGIYGPESPEDRHKAELSIQDIIRKHLNHTPLERLELDRGEIECEVRHWAVSLIAKSLQDTLADAPNFVTMDIFTPKAGPLTVTVQRQHGISAPEAINELVGLVERLVAEHPAPPSDAYRDAAEYLASRAKAAQACAHHGAVEGLRHRVSWWRRVLFTASVVLGNLGRLGL